MNPSSSRTEAVREAYRSAARLATVLAAMWLLFAGPAVWLAGSAALEGLSYAAVLCLLPGCLAFFIAAQFRSVESPNLHALVMLSGTVLRLLFVLGGVLAVRAIRAELGFTQFLVWVIVFYFASLAVETRFLLKQTSVT